MSKPKEAPGAQVVEVARAWIGTPYHDQASVRGVGCDCLGLLRGVWRDLVGPEPMPVPTYSRDWGEVGHREVLIEALHKVMLRRRALYPGRVLVFRMRDGSICKHIGITTAPDRFVHAYERLGVVEVELTPPWRRRVACVFAFPEGV